jgi:6,7-dimethyl-8-ribityllumazine synthase
MSNQGHDLSAIAYAGTGNHTQTRVAIVVSKWNTEITEALCKGAFSVLEAAGVKPANIFRTDVPGSFELPMGARHSIAKNRADAVICLGCVIQGETRHFDFICQAVADGVMRLNLDTGKPVIFGVLTPNNQQQALDRAGGRLGNKGCEAAVAALEMIDLLSK